ncbi:uncharacterized protein NPIL_511211 [Nephila pilipes]|uniref:Uncharacterized protein n=1 Tax=Nephila pilipes TaxID=299642 RepID=A0A8X6MNX9_NEPPI|nr:uncharacterized protein NPIL_511211 [Nephila pilipes]
MLRTRKVNFLEVILIVFRIFVNFSADAALATGNSVDRSFEPPNMPFAPPDHLPPIASNITNAVSITVGPAAESFVGAFVQNVESSMALTQLLDLSQTTGQQYAQFLYKYCLSWLLKMGVLNGRIAAEFATRPVAQNFPNLPLSTMSRVYGNIAARFLFSVEILNRENAELLGTEYAKMLEKSAKRYGYSQPDSKCVAIFEGLSNFSSFVTPMTPEKAWKLTLTYGIVFLFEAIEYGSTNYCIF